MVHKLDIKKRKENNDSECLNEQVGCPRMNV